MRKNFHIVLGAGLLVISAAALILWVRSFWISDWVLWIHRDQAGVISHVGAATWGGVFGLNAGRGNASQYSDQSNNIFQYNVQLLAHPNIPPLASDGHHFAGFGYFWDSETSANGVKYHRFLQFTAPGWFVSLAFAVPGLLLFRRARRLKRIAQLNLCVHCGYDLRATPDRCPECGAIPSPPAHQTPRESADVRRG